MESAGKRIVGCLPGSEGAALNTGCFVRYSLKPFYVYESPSGSGSSSASLIRRVGAALGATFGAVLVIAAALIWRRRNSRGDDFEGQCSIEEVSKVFHIGLLCTQASPNLRPAMWKVVEMLLGEGRDLPLPTQPPFINFRDVEPGSVAPSSAPKQPASVNQLSISIMEGR
ncbi:hypothetical protein L1049_016205 [Liquidambar formosana]|uniref:Uncharacterized protein n=1 Tax=Liquidambar formosana TaxID=63359 RepID=A0AAP0S613_LIQFO